MKVLSLFDGMACGMLAMQAAGIKVDRYVAFEIDKYAVKTSSHNFPMIEHRGDVFKADFTEFSGFDFVVGGSPCTYWSIAQKNNRETEASGMGWELFSQYVRAVKEAQPMYFIYENNKSMSKAIRESITETFGFEPICINSSLVSAQNRQRLYWVGKRNLDGTYSRVHVDQPEDRGILLRDVLDGNFAPLITTTEGKSFVVAATEGRGTNPQMTLTKHRRTMIAEPVNTTDDGKCIALKAQYFKDNVSNFVVHQSAYGFKSSGVAEPVRIPEYGIEEKARPLGANYSNNCGGFEHRMFSEKRSKQQVDMVAAPVRVGLFPNDDGVAENHQQNRVYSIDGKSINLCGNGGGMGAKTGLYAVPLKVGEIGNGGQGNRVYSVYGKSVAQTAQSGGLGSNTGLYAIPIEFENGIPIKAISGADGKTYSVFLVKDGQITIKGKRYPIKLADGYYIIRKLTVSECKRLQTVPEWYEFPVSDTQAYKMLGNGWTVEVIAHLLNATQADVQAEEQLSLFKMGVM